MKKALVTGASRGLGRALAAGLAAAGYALVIDARDGAALAAAPASVIRDAAPGPTSPPLAGDVTDPAHRAALREPPAISTCWSTTRARSGPLRCPPLADYPAAELRAAFEANVIAPIALAQLFLPGLRERGGALLNITSDAAVEPYAGWGGYGAAKAALEQASNVLAAEETAIRVWWVDPGDLRTDMHQAAFPGEDISDRPLPESVVPAFVRLVEERLPSGRYRADELDRRPTGSRPSMTVTADFTLPADLEAPAPPEKRGLPRDGVRMLVSRAASGTIAHHRFTDLPRLLLPGDLLVVNTSRTLPAAVPVGPDLTMHFSTGLPGRDLARGTADPGRDIQQALWRRGTSRGHRPARRRAAHPDRAGWRPAVAGPAVHGGGAIPAAARRAHPLLVRDGSAGRWRRTRLCSAAGPGSAEMPSAARPFTPAVVTDLAARGVTIAPVTLHCGVSSLEADEDPYPEQYDVPPATARLVNLTRQSGGRVIAAGTTVVRALETAAVRGLPGCGTAELAGPGSRPRPAGRRMWSPRRPAFGWWTACSPGCMSHAQPTCGCWPPSMARTCCGSATTKPWPTATSGTSSATSTCCSPSRFSRRRSRTWPSARMGLAPAIRCAAATRRPSRRSGMPVR